MNDRDFTDRLRAVADDVGFDARVHVRRLDSQGVAGTSLLDVGEVALHAEVPMPMASLYKVALVAAWSDLVADGRLDPRDRVHLPGEGRFTGPTGIAALADDVDVSQRDAARLAICVSDNTSADALLQIVGLDVVNTWLADHGFEDIVVRRGSQESLTRIMREMGSDSPGAALDVLAEPSRAVTTSEYDPALAGSATARSLTQLLAHVWSADRYAWLRASMTQQPWRHRVASGFPHDDVTVAGKTGSLGHLRHEVAVVQYPFEHSVAVAVMTRAWRSEIHQPRVDAAIGQLAHLCVSTLRRHRGDG